MLTLPRAWLAAAVGAVLATPALAASVSHDRLNAEATGRSPATPVHVRTIATGETGWFASPGLVDLTGDGGLEIVAPTYTTQVFSADGRLLASGRANPGRVYPPAVVVDLDADSHPEIVVAGDGAVTAYRFHRGRLLVLPGWPASVRSGGQTPEVRGLAAADLDGDGTVEVVATTTNTAPHGSQVFVFAADGNRYQPRPGHRPAWPRYNDLPGRGNDKHFNGQGNHGYGAYGLNVGIGELDDDPEQEIVVTFDNHQINVFNHDGTSVLAAPWFTNRDSRFDGRRLGWGQFIRWLSPRVERRHLHRHRGSWPDVRRTPWLQWTASPPSVADLDGDGHGEVIGIPNVERGIPYRTRAHAVMVLDGAQGNGLRSARRHLGFETLPLTARPVHRPDGDWYPPSGVPSPTLVDLGDDGLPEIVFPGNDGYIYAVSGTGRRLWRWGFAPGRARTFASEVSAADLDGDGDAELVFGVYGAARRSGRLVVLTGSGRLISDQRLAHQRHDGNGIGIAAAPSIADIDGDGDLEIVTLSIDHGLDVFTVPGSVAAALDDAPAWPTGRGSLLRAGRSDDVPASIPGSVGDRP